jgi:hypothetical protein
MAYVIEVNGLKRTVDADEDYPFLWVLRDELDLKGCKFGCGVGLCAGAATGLNAFIRIDPDGRDDHVEESRNWPRRQNDAADDGRRGARRRLEERADRTGAEAADSATMDANEFPAGLVPHLEYGQSMIELAVPTGPLRAPRSNALGFVVKVRR